MQITETFLLCLALLESGCKDVPNSEGSGAVGYFQMKPVAVKEANRILEDAGFAPGFYELSDRHDYFMARSMACVILEHWRPILEVRYSKKWTVYDALALWHYGPTDWRPDSKYRLAIDRERSRQYDQFLRIVKRAGGYREFLRDHGVITEDKLDRMVAHQ